MKRFFVALAVLAVPVAAQAQQGVRTPAAQARVAVPGALPTNTLLPVDANLLNQAQAQGGLSAAVVNMMQLLAQLQQQVAQNKRQARSAQQEAAYQMLLLQADKIREAANAALISNVVAGQMQIAGGAVSAVAPSGAKIANPNARGPIAKLGQGGSNMGGTGAIAAGAGAIGQPVAVIGTAQQVYAAKMAEAEAVKQQTAQQGAAGADALLAQQHAMLVDIMNKLQQIMAAQNQAMQNISRQ